MPPQPPRDSLPPPLFKCPELGDKALIEKGPMIPWSYCVLGRGKQCILPSWHEQQPQASVLQNCRQWKGVKAAQVQGRLGPVERRAHVSPLAGSQMPVTGVNASLGYMEPTPRQEIEFGGWKDKGGEETWVRAEHPGTDLCLASPHASWTHLFC